MQPIPPTTKASFVCVPLPALVSGIAAMRGVTGTSAKIGSEAFHRSGPGISQPGY